MKNTTLVTALILGFVGGLAGHLFGSHILQDEAGRRQDYFATSAATLVSPHHLRKQMEEGTLTDTIIVDLRTAPEYEESHIKGAINIDASEGKESVLEKFRALDHDKEVIIYCYSAACMTGRKTGDFLAKNDVFVKELTIGWNEWHKDWETWNYAGELDGIDMDEFITNKGEIEEVKEESTVCPIENDLAC